MNVTLIKSIFGFLSLFFSIICSTLLFGEGLTVTSAITGVIVGVSIYLLMTGFERFFKRLHIKSFNTSALGLFFGYFLGLSFSAVVDGFFHVSHVNISIEIATFIKVVSYLSGIYLGLVFTMKSSEELQLSIPFVKLKPTKLKKKDILLDPSIFQDSRLIDLASSGLVDHHLVLPRFVIKDLYHEVEHGEETDRIRARRSLDVIKRLESIQELDLRYIESDFPELKDQVAKLIRLARLVDANIITSDISRIQQSTIESVEGIRIINLRSLANALKPLTQSGETIQIKIQRYGKESRQGVGYLEDGTMVVVNGGAEYLGEVIKAHVLSVKHTSSGRMIFCNAAEEEIEGIDHEINEPSYEMQTVE